MTDQARGMTRSNAGDGRCNQSRTPKVKMVVGQGSPNVGVAGNCCPSSDASSG
jgi:hypothetical protein